MYDSRSLKIEALERELEALKKEVVRLKKSLAGCEVECKNLKRWYKRAQEDNNSLAINLGDSRHDVLTLQDYFLRRMDELESLRDVSARGLLVDRTPDLQAPPVGGGARPRELFLELKSLNRLEWSDDDRALVSLRLLTAQSSILRESDKNSRLAALDAEISRRRLHE